MDFDPHLTTDHSPRNADAHQDTPVPNWPEHWPGGRAPTVLQVVPTLVTGGAERGCIDMALALQAAGGKPLVASEGGPMVRELVVANLPLAPLCGPDCPGPDAERFPASPEEAPAADPALLSAAKDWLRAHPGRF